MKNLILIFSFLFTLSYSNAQNINFIPADPQPELLEVYAGSFASGDIDADGDQDLFMAGITPASKTELYLNDGFGNFLMVENTSFPKAASSVAKFEDLDADGDLDLFFSGTGNSILEFIHIYLNDGQGHFSQLPNPSLPQSVITGFDIEDVDGDNDPDLFISSKDANGQFIADLYLNDGNANFTPAGSTVFTSLEFGAVVFLDAENDGDADIIISGQQENGSALTKLYLNDGAGNYSVDINADFVQMGGSVVDVADTDNDGDFDILISGRTGLSEVKTILYLNDGNGQFAELNATGLQQTFAGTNAIADLDNDGDQDLVIIGSQEGGLPNIYNIVYENLGNNEFIPVDTLGGEYIAACVVEDFNGDGLADIIIQGFVDKTNVYWNDSSPTSVADLAEAHSLMIFPNPSSGSFTVSMEEVTTTLDLRIYTIQGKLVQEELNVSGWNREFRLDLSPGTYLIQLRAGDSMTTKKLIIGQ